MTQSWILEKKRQEHFPQQHVLLAPPASQLLHCNCRQRITVRIQFLSLSFRFYISLETLLETLGSMLTVSRYAHLDWQYFMKWQSTKCGPSRLAEWGVALLVTGQDVSERAQLLPPSFPHFFFFASSSSWRELHGSVKGRFWGLNQPAPLNVLPCHYRPDWRHPFVSLLLERWVPEEGLTRPTQVSCSSI